MGNCAGGDKRTRQIQKEQDKAEDAEARKIRILLLGAGESGKTTLFKQMKLLYTKEKQFSTDERKGFMRVIYKNIIQDIGSLVAHAYTTAKEGREEPIDDFLATPEANNAAKRLESFPKEQDIGPEEGEILELLWNDKVVQDCWTNRGVLQVQDALRYFMDSIKRISSPDWQPTNQDILRARARTSGVVQASFEIQRTRFEMYDVGGQRTERKKWIHYFDGVTTVLFVAAISEYNQVLFEDPTVNRQDEAVALFKKQLQEDTFLNTPFILFLNKKDLFREKLTKVPFKITAEEAEKTNQTRRNEDFNGPPLDLTKHYNYEEEGADKVFEAHYTSAIQYLAKLYELQAPPTRGPDGQIYTHPTNSTDSENINKIMNSCKDIILKEHLAGGGWM